MKRLTKWYKYSILACYMCTDTVRRAMQNFTANRNAYPLSDAEHAEHWGEIVAFSIDGIHALAFGKTVDDIRAELQERYQMTTKDVVLDTVN